MKKPTFLRKNKHIPTQLTEIQFAEFILPHLTEASQGLSVVFRSAKYSITFC
jgi:hypothetical protein